MMYDVMYDVMYDTRDGRLGSMVFGLALEVSHALQLYPGPVVVSMSQPGGNHGNRPPAHTRPIAVLHHQ